MRSITESYNVGLIYDSKKIQLQQQYLTLIQKKNELDYINTPFFTEKQLRESLNYYKAGEKLVIFTEELTPIISEETSHAKKDPTQEWLKVLLYGIEKPKF